MPWEMTCSTKFCLDFVLVRGFLTSTHCVLSAFLLSYDLHNWILFHQCLYSVELLRIDCIIGFHCKTTNEHNWFVYTNAGCEDEIFYKMVCSLCFRREFLTNTRVLSAPLTSYYFYSWILFLKICCKDSRKLYPNPFGASSQVNWIHSS